MKTYDLVIIGSGTAAQVASARVRAAGWSVALVDHRPFGGTCALRGCDPKKMLISGAEAIDAETRMHGHGVTGEARIDWRDLMMFKRSFTDAVPRNRERDFAENGIDAFHGVARFTGRDAIVTEGREFNARYILIAAGRWISPAKSMLSPATCFLSLIGYPRASCWLAAAATSPPNSRTSQLGPASMSQWLQRAERMLPAFDPDLVGWLMEKFGELGIDVRTRTTVQRIEKTVGGFIVHASTDGQEQEVAADLVVHAAGREPDLAALDLAAGGVATENGRVKLNEFLQSVSNPKVYAAGDAASSGPPLTPVSGHDGKVVAKTFSTATGTGRTTAAFRASHSQFRQSPRLASARRKRARGGSNSECIRTRSPTGTRPGESMKRSTASRR